MTYGKHYVTGLFSQGFHGKGGCNSVTEAFERMGNVWDLRYEERSVFCAVTRNCMSNLLQRLVV